MHLTIVIVARRRPGARQPGRGRRYGGHVHGQTPVADPAHQQRDPHLPEQRPADLARELGVVRADPGERGEGQAEQAATVLGVQRGGHAGAGHQGRAGCQGGGRV